MAGLDEQNRILAEKLGKLYQTTSERIAEIKSAKTSLEEAVDTAKRKIDDEWKTVNLGSIKVASYGAASSSPVSPQSKRTMKVQGKVLVINKQHGFVIVSLGSVDGVSASTRFAVSRQSASVAVLAVMEIQEMMTACRIEEVKNGQTPEVDDDVEVLPPGP